MSAEGTPRPGAAGAMANARGRHISRRRWSFPIGRIAGIQIRVHLTFFLLVPLFVFAGMQPDTPGVAASLGWLVIIFGCVVLHELGHCLVGRRHGVGVHEIDLLPIGGVSKLERLPARGRDEFAIALAGPAVSIGIAAASAVLAVGADVALTPVDWFGGPLVTRLMWFNLVIGVFNLVPAFPLDGGRVLRSLLERNRNLEDATNIAAKVGRRLAIAMGVLGLLGAPLLVLIAVFVYLGASAEEVATRIHVRLERHTVGDVVDRDARSIETARGLAALGTVDVRDDLEARVADLVASPGHALAVTDSGHVVGLVRLSGVERLVRDFPGPAPRRGVDEASPASDW